MLFRSGLHAKPIFLLDVEGYWQPLIRLLDHVIAEGFAAASMRDLFQTVQTTEGLINSLHLALAD